MIKPVTKATKLYGAIIVAGYALTAVGCLGLFMGLLGLIDLSRFAIGLSSGIRVLGSLAISGCLLSAVGHWVDDYF